MRHQWLPAALVLLCGPLQPVASSDAVLNAPPELEVRLSQVYRPPVHLQPVPPPWEIGSKLHWLDTLTIKFLRRYTTATPPTTLLYSTFLESTKRTIAIQQEPAAYCRELIVGWGTLHCQIQVQHTIPPLQYWACWN